jgi:hypothetical protein
MDTDTRRPGSVRAARKVPTLVKPVGKAAQLGKAAVAKVASPAMKTSTTSVPKVSQTMMEKETSTMEYEDARGERWDYYRPSDGNPQGFPYAIRKEGKPGTVAWVKREEDAELISNLGSAIQIMDGNKVVAWASSKEIADLITRSREDLPSLLDEREWLLKERERLIERIARLEAKV